MQKWVLQYLCCPKTKEPLELHITRKKGKEILEGTLISKKTKNVYPIKNGVPRFVKDTFQDAKSVESFGFEWNTLNFDKFRKSWVEDIAKRNFKSTKYFKNKFVVECGAGSGMHTRWMLESGASKIIALELSNTVDDVMRRNLKGYDDRLAIIQADISEPPIQPNSVNGLVYCFNVIQHTKDPLETTAKNLYALVGKNGSFAFNVYMTRSRILNLLDPRVLLRHITVHLPKRVLLGLCYAASVLGMIPGIRFIARNSLLVQGDFKKGEDEFRRRYLSTVTSTYDYYGGHRYQYIYTYGELKKFFDRWKMTRKVENLQKYANGAPLPGQALILRK